MREQAFTSSRQHCIISRASPPQKIEMLMLIRAYGIMCSRIETNFGLGLQSAQPSCVHARQRSGEGYSHQRPPGRDCCHSGYEGGGSHSWKIKYTGICTYKYEKYMQIIKVKIVLLRSHIHDIVCFLVNHTLRKCMHVCTV